MARPLRIEFSGAVYHLTSRGNARQNIFRVDEDRHNFLDLLSKACDRYQWRCHAYCLMSNHYHLLIETMIPSLSRGMKYINGVYTQSFNRRHSKVGHVFQGRFKSILVDRDSYLLELSRYIVLNPVRAGMVRAPEEWSWSSYLATAGLAIAHPALTTDWVLGNFGKRRKNAELRYKNFVRQDGNRAGPWEALKNQIYLGPDEFVQAMQGELDPGQSLLDIPREQIQKPPQPLSYFRKKYKERNRAMAEAYRSGHYTLTQVGKAFGVSYATVSRAVKKLESESGCDVKCKV
jgi:REP element-mobilizing transposase RayT